jgi:hypothetical protein
MKQFVEAVEAEETVEHYSNGPVKTGKGWESDAVRPFSEHPEDKGLYIVTTYDEFFREDLAKAASNGGPPSK